MTMLVHFFKHYISVELAMIETSFKYRHVEQKQLYDRLCVVRGVLKEGG